MDRYEYDENDKLKENIENTENMENTITNANQNHQTFIEVKTDTSCLSFLTVSKDYRKCNKIHSILELIYNVNTLTKGKCTRCKADDLSNFYHCEICRYILCRRCLIANLKKPMYEFLEYCQIY